MADAGLLFARMLDGQGGARDCPEAETHRYRPDDPGILWGHYDLTADDTEAALRSLPALDRIVVDALLAEEPRPRAARHGNGLLIVFRGVNMNPGAEPEDMISIRLWMEPGRIISVRKRRILSIQDILARLDRGEGPASEADFLCTLGQLLSERVGQVVTDLDETVDGLEDKVSTETPSQLRHQIADLRRQAVHLRRYLAPQREGMMQLQAERVDWIDESAKLRLREIGDRTSRFIEDLDSARERAAVCQEELAARMAEQLNSRMYLLAIVAGIFLPLGLLTGLLGINVGGMPGVDSPAAFWIVCAVLPALGAAELWLLRRKRWF